jgi:glycosyltransferase involved in cell wall biosynthesis
LESRFVQQYREIPPPQLVPISIIIPCRNETRGTLIRALDKLQTTLHDYLLDVIIVENGSDNLENIPNTRWYLVEQGGLGLALKIGLMKAANERVFFLPADMSYDLTFVELASYLEGADIVIASKFLPGSRVERPFTRQLASRLYEMKNRYLEHLTVTDVTGAKMFRRSTVLPLLSECPHLGIRFEVELLKAAQRRKMVVEEIPAIVHDYGKRGLMRWAR